MFPSYHVPPKVLSSDVRSMVGRSIPAFNLSMSTCKTSFLPHFRGFIEL
jgi:hypothetical protein